MESRCFPGIAVLLIVCVAASAPGQMRRPKADRTSQPGRAEAALAAIGELSVVIRQQDSDPNSIGIDCKELEAKVRQKLHAGGLRVIRPASKADAELGIDIDLLRLARCDQYVLRVQTHITRTVVVPRAGELSARSIVWQAKPVMEAVNVSDVAVRANSAVLEQVETFIGCCRVTNAEGIGTRDTNAAKAGQSLVRKPTGPGPYPLVASRNSKVFHRADCPLAQKIKPENLVGYYNVEQALAAGKKPCKQCKP